MPTPQANKSTAFKLGNGRSVKLGRIRPKKLEPHGRFLKVTQADDRTIYVPRFSCHFDPPQRRRLAAITTNWMNAMKDVWRQTYGNTQWGDCVIASKLKQVGGWTANSAGKPALSSDSEAVQTYQRICGPGDNGCVITDVLDAFQRDGLPLAGQAHKIAGYAAVDPANPVAVRTCCEVFGPGLCIGINLPSSWMGIANDNGFIWDDTQDSPIGGHDVNIADVNDTGAVINTWGMWGTVTWAAMADNSIVEECYVELAPDWYSQGNLAPNGINAATLAADLAIVQSGQIPPVGPVPPTPPTPPTTGLIVYDPAGTLAAQFAPLYTSSGSGNDVATIQQVIGVLQGVIVTLQQLLAPSPRARDRINFLKLIQDLMKLVSDFGRNPTDISTLMADIIAIVSDFQAKLKRV